MTDKEQHILNRLDKRLIKLKKCYPVEYKKILNITNAKRAGNTLQCVNESDKYGRVTNKPWSDELINEIDKRLTKYEESLDE